MVSRRQLLLFCHLAASLQDTAAFVSPTFLRTHRQGSPFFVSRGIASPEEGEDRHSRGSGRGRATESPKDHSFSAETAYNGLDGASPLPPPVESEERRLRRQSEAKVKSRFAHGDELHNLRRRVLELKDQLIDARRSNSIKKAQQLKRTILDSQQRDAEFVYSVGLERTQKAALEGNEEDVIKFRGEAMAARSCLPQFQLGGLWVGKYGDHGYEMINVTYIGDTLVATKVTGDRNVPKGQVTFLADLSPNLPEDQLLEPIELTEAASRQWDTKHLARFTGRGQVAGEGFSRSQWLEGQLIMVGDYFSFAWVPIGHQVFFGRPSAELTLKLLQESQRVDTDDVEKMRAFATRCLEHTEHLEEEARVEGGSAFLSDQQGYYNQEGCFE